MESDVEQLSKSDWNFLYSHYQLAKDTPLGSALTGNHWLLLSALTRLGFPVHSLTAAYRIAEGLLWPNY